MSETMKHQTYMGSRSLSEYKLAFLNSLHDSTT